MKKILFLSLLSIITSIGYTQTIYQHTSSESIYQFLDEMADLQVIELNSSLKPYSRKFISTLLYNIDPNSLNLRQKQELIFFKKEYIKEAHRDSLLIFQSEKFFSKNHFFNSSKFKRKDFFFYEDGNTQVSINPVLGVDYNISANGFQRRYGGKVEAYFAKNWGVYFSFRDVAENLRVTNNNFINQYPGGVVRVKRTEAGQQTDYSEVRGGITYSWKWGSIGLVKDQYIWGNNQNGALIFSGKQPATSQLKIDIKPTKWFEFNYIHAWLNSEVIDSTRSFNINTGVDRQVFKPKYLATNMFVIKPFKSVYFSFGNSIVYSDMPVHPSYLLPFLFYRSVDHQLSSQDNRSGQNGQLFFDLSIRRIKNIHIYSTLFIDEIRLSTIWDKERQRNQFSYKAGMRASNILNSNASFIFEYTRSNPFTYRHFIPTTTFESNDYNLGHYLKDNAQELYVALQYQPIQRLSILLYYLNIEKGEELVFSQGASGGVEGVPFLEKTIYSQNEIGLKARYEVLHDVSINAKLNFVQIEDDLKILSPDFMQGDNVFFTIGTNINF